MEQKINPQSKNFEISDVLLYFYQKEIKHLAGHLRLPGFPLRLPEKIRFAKIPGFPGKNSGIQCTEY